MSHWAIRHKASTENNLRLSAAAYGKVGVPGHIPCCNPVFSDVFRGVLAGKQARFAVWASSLHRQGCSACGPGQFAGRRSPPYWRVYQPVPPAPTREPPGERLGHLPETEGGGPWRTGVDRRLNPALQRGPTAGSLRFLARKRTTVAATLLDSTGRRTTLFRQESKNWGRRFNKSGNSNAPGHVLKSL